MQKKVVILVCEYRNTFRYYVLTTQKKIIAKKGHNTPITEEQEIGYVDEKNFQKSLEKLSAILQKENITDFETQNGLRRSQKRKHTTTQGCFKLSGDCLHTINELKTLKEKKLVAA